MVRYEDLKREFMAEQGASRRWAKASLDWGDAAATWEVAVKKTPICLRSARAGLRPGDRGCRLHVPGLRHPTNHALPATTHGRLRPVTGQPSLTVGRLKASAARSLPGGILVIRYPVPTWQPLRHQARRTRPSRRAYGRRWPSRRWRTRSMTAMRAWKRPGRTRPPPPSRRLPRPSRAGIRPGRTRLVAWPAPSHPSRRTKREGMRRGPPTRQPPGRTRPAWFWTWRTGGRTSATGSEPVSYFLCLG